MHPDFADRAMLWLVLEVCVQLDVISPALAGPGITSRSHSELVSKHPEGQLSSDQINPEKGRPAWRVLVGLRCLFVLPGLAIALTSCSTSAEPNQATKTKTEAGL